MYYEPRTRRFDLAEEPRGGIRRGSQAGKNYLSYGKYIVRKFLMPSGIRVQYSNHYQKLKSFLNSVMSTVTYVIFLICDLICLINDNITAWLQFELFFMF